MKKILILLALSLSLSIACSPIRIYRDMPEVKAWETEILKFEELDKSETYPDNSILFAGSSSIRLWSTIANDLSSYPVIQRGYGGAKLSDFAVYTERIIWPHKNIDGIVLFIANDISGHETDKSPEEVLKLFKYVVKTIRKELPETPVFWIGITPTELRWEAWPQIREANNLIRDYTIKNSDLYFIATERSFINEDGKPRPELFLSDKLHLNDEGYRVWTELIRYDLDRVLK